MRGELQLDPNDPISSLLEIAKADRVDPSLPSVLCLIRDQVHSDIHAVRTTGFGSKYNWVGVWSNYLADIQRPWVAQHLQRQRYDQTSDGEEGWDRCAEFAETLLKRMRAELGVVAVVSGNFDYWTDEGLRRTCKALGLPFLVLLKEVSINSRYTSTYYQNYTFRPDVTAVAIAAQGMKELLVNCNVLPADTIFSTGLPRLDWWLRGHPPIFSRESVVCFAFPGSDYFADETFQDTFNGFISASKRNERHNLSFVMKCKGKSDIRNLKNQQIAAFPDHNVKFTAETLMPGILANARAAIGYNSLSMVEALLAAIPIYYPYWGDAVTGNLLFFPDDPLISRQVNFLHSPAELAAILDHVSAAKPAMPTFNTDERLEIVRRYVDFRTDISSTQRLEEFISRFAA